MVVRCFWISWRKERRKNKGRRLAVMQGRTIHGINIQERGLAERASNLCGHVYRLPGHVWPFLSLILGRPGPPAPGFISAVGRVCGMFVSVSLLHRDIYGHEWRAKCEGRWEIRTTHLITWTRPTKTTLHFTDYFFALLEITQMCLA